MVERRKNLRNKDCHLKITPKVNESSAFDLMQKLLNFVNPNRFRISWKAYEGIRYWKTSSIFSQAQTFFIPELFVYRKKAWKIEYFLRFGKPVLVNHFAFSS